MKEFLTRIAEPRPPRRENVALLMDRVGWLVEERWREFTRYHLVGKTIDKIAQEITGKKL